MPWGPQGTAGDGNEDEYYGLPEIFHQYTSADLEYTPGGFSLTDPVYIKTYFLSDMFYGYTDQDCTGNPSGNYYVIPEFSDGPDPSWSEVTAISAAAQKCTQVPGSGTGKAYQARVHIMFGTVIFVLY